MRLAHIESIPGYFQSAVGTGGSKLISDLFLPGKEQEGLTADESLMLYNEVREAWESSESHRCFSQALSSLSTRRLMNNAIAFGIGSIAGRPGVQHGAYWRETVLTSVLQLVTFISMANQRPVGHSSQGLVLYAQELLYTSDDAKLLAELGVVELDFPEAERLVDFHSLVYAPKSNFNVAVLTLTRCNVHCPGIYVGPSIDRLKQWLNALLPTQNTFLSLESSRVVELTNQLRVYELGHRFVEVFYADSPFAHAAYMKEIAHIPAKVLENNESWKLSCNKVATPPRFTPKSQGLQYFEQDHEEYLALLL